MTVAIFVYGTVVFGIVSLALSLFAWGIVNERRDRTRFEQGREVFGEATASMQASNEHGAGRDDAAPARPSARLRRPTGLLAARVRAARPAGPGRDRGRPDRTNGPGHRGQRGHRRGSLRGPAEGRRDRAPARPRPESDRSGRLQDRVSPAGRRRAARPRALRHLGSLPGSVASPRSSWHVSPRSTCSSTTPACSPSSASAAASGARAHLRHQRPRAVPAHLPAAAGALAPAPPSRVVTVSSGGMYTARLDADDPQLDDREFDGPDFYAHSKRAEVVLNRLWSERHASDGDLVSRHAPRLGRHRRASLVAAPLPPADAAAASRRDPGRRHDRLAGDRPVARTRQRRVLARPRAASRAPCPLDTRDRSRARAPLGLLRAARHARRPFPTPSPVRPTDQPQPEGEPNGPIQGNCHLAVTRRPTSGAISPTSARSPNGIRASRTSGSPRGSPGRLAPATSSRSASSAAGLSLPYVTVAVNAAHTRRLRR